ncbi:MAG: hypothetical protein WA118_01705 [Carboxydocellales bacterium]
MFNRYFEAGEYNREFLFAHLTVKNIDFALISLECILEREEFDVTLYTDMHTYYFFHLQSLLAACGNISNVFYSFGFGGLRTRRESDRSRELRELFGINRRSFPLVFQKEFRNTNEHFDERIDSFCGNMGDYNILDRYTPQHLRDTVHNNPHLRTFDRECGIYHTFDRSLRPIQFNLHNLKDELLEMRRRITSAPIFNDGWIDRIPGDIIE